MRLDRGGGAATTNFFTRELEALPLLATLLFRTLALLRLQKHALEETEGEKGEDNVPRGLD